MKRRGYAVLIGVLLAGLLCLAMVHDRPAFRGEHGRLTLWYAEEDCPRPVMEALLADYRQETRCLVKAVAYPDEGALGDAFEDGKPDLLPWHAFRIPCVPLHYTAYCKALNLFVHANCKVRPAVYRKRLHTGDGITRPSERIEMVNKAISLGYPETGMNML